MAEKSEVTIPSEDFFKSLGKLEALARGTEEQSGDNLSKAQLFHTPSNSERKTWPGGDTTDYSNNWDDRIGKDGTDYKPARKAIAEKAMKGLPLTPEEIAILKGDIENSINKGEGQEVEGRDPTPGPKGESRPVCKGQDEDKPAKEEQEKACKSLNEIAPEYEAVQTGVEISPFLSEFVKAISSRMDMIEKSMNEQVVHAANGILDSVGEYMEGRFEEMGKISKSMAEVLSNIGHGIAGNMEKSIAQSEQPVGPPKSQLRLVDGQPAQPIEKSFDGPQGADISKSQILGVMTDLVEKGQVSSVEVCKYEMTDQIRPELEQQIVSQIKSAGSK
jgi:hypothetical protein